MKIKYQGNLNTLPADVRACGVPGTWRSRNDGAHHQFKAVTGEYLNYWPSKGTVMFQGRSGGPLARRFAKLAASPPRATPSAGRTVKVVPKSLLDLGPRCPHDPMDFGWRHSVNGADLAALNERQAQLRSVVAGLPFAAAVAELILSSVRHAVDYRSEDEVSEALKTVAAKISFGGYKWIDLLALIAATFQAESDDEL